MRVFLIFLVCSFQAFSQNVYFKSVTTLEGLSNNSVNTITSDANGDLWVGTWDGITLYDGHKFRILKHDPQDHTSISGNNILSFTKDANDQIWIQTDSKKLSKAIGAIEAQKLAATIAEPSAYRKPLFQQYEFKRSIASVVLNQANGIEVTLDNGTSQVYDKTKDEFVPVLHTNVAPKQKAKSTNEQKISAYFKETYPNEHVNQIFEVSKGVYYIATQRTGLYVIQVSDEGNIKRVDNYVRNSGHSQGLLSNEITIIYKDQVDNIWLGFKDGGIALAQNENSITALLRGGTEAQPFLPEQTVRAITKNKQHTYFVGYYTKGLFSSKSPKDAFKPYVLHQAGANPEWNRIRSLYTDSFNVVWVGTYAGVVKLEGAKQTYYSMQTTPHFLGNRVYGFVQDEAHLWVAGSNGLSKYNYAKGMFEDFISKEKLAQYQFRSVTRKGNVLYLSTEKNGIILYDSQSGSIKQLDQNQGLLGNSVFIVYIDPITEYVWVASLGGITILDRDFKVIKRIAEAQGLPSHLVYSLDPLKDKVWMSTSKGVAFVDKNTFKVLNYSNLYGWQSVEFSEGAHYIDPLGEIIYGGHNGINFFKPLTFSNANHASFRLWINEELSTSNQKLHYDAGVDHLSLELYVSGFDTYGSNQFEYRIKGLFEQWRILPSHTITLDGLSANNYTIEVRDVLDTTGKIIFKKSFQIAKPFYQRGWFIVSCMLLVLVLLRGLYNYKQRKQQAQQKKLEQIVADRTAQINQQTVDLAIQNTELTLLQKQLQQQTQDLVQVHSELKNEDIEMEQVRAYVLSFIKAPLVKVLEQLQQRDPATIVAAQNEIVKLYDTIREWDYISASSLDAPSKLSDIQLREYTDYLLNDSMSLANKYPIQITHNNNLTSSWVSMDVLALKMLYLYGLHECAKWMKHGQQLFIKVTEENQILCISFSSDSEELKNYWQSNGLYSTYFRAIKHLLNQQGGFYQTVLQPVFSLEIQVPFRVISEPASVGISYQNYLEEIKVLPKDSINILVFAAKEDVVLVEQLLHELPLCNLIYCHAASDVIHYVGHYEFDAIVVYHVCIDKKLEQLIKQLKKSAHKQELLLFYLSHQVDYYNQEQLFIWGIQEVIHLPSSKEVLQSKLFNRIERDKKQKNKNSLAAIISRSNQDEVTLSSEQKLIQKAIVLIQNRLSDTDFDIQTLTEELGVSKIKCYRLFKEELQLSPSEVLLEMRMKKAERLLVQHNLNVAEISDECGYNDPKYFSKTFKKYFGVSPSNYQNHADQRID